MEHFEYDFMEGMSDEEVTRWLEERDTGILALARDGEAYAIPVSYVYGAGSLYVRLAHDEDSRKFDFIEATEEACLVVYGRVDDHSVSVVATGPLERLTGDRAAVFDDTAMNATFGPLHVFDEPVEDLAVDIYELDVEVVTGRMTESLPPDTWATDRDEE